LSRSLARKLGGELKLVSSEMGAGSVFELIIPLRDDLKQGELPIGSNHEATKFLKRRILYVEDADDIRFLVKKQLSERGFLVEVCNEGASAVAMLKEGRDFDLILMDLNLPVMNGYAATKMIRQGGYSKPVLAFTAYSDTCERGKLREFGFNDLISKVHTGKELGEIISSWI
jgi:CheY-like chemotaxis protein